MNLSLQLPDCWMSINSLHDAGCSCTFLKKHEALVKATQQGLHPVMPRSSHNDTAPPRRARCGGC